MARKFAGVMIGEPEDLWLLASDAGYGFTVRLKELRHAIARRQDGAQRPRERAGAAAGAGAGARTRWWRSVSSEGKLLVFPVGEVPEMPRGKGNKLYDIPGKKARERSELMTAVAVVPPKASLVLWSGEMQKVARVARAAGLPAASARSAARCSGAAGRAASTAWKCYGQAVRLERGLLHRKMHSGAVRRTRLRRLTSAAAPSTTSSGALTK